jgi:hypothetical protein
MPLIRERMLDILVRKRSFVGVEEYLTRHPDFIHALRARPGMSSLLTLSTPSHVCWLLQPRIQRRLSPSAITAVSISSDVLISPVGLHPNNERQAHVPRGQPESAAPKPLILVRWLGKDFDAQRILEIKKMEFGGKGKMKKKTKGRF